MSELASLSEEARQIALQRYHIIQPHLEHGKRLCAVAQDANIPYRTVQRWVAQYRRFGLSGLVRKPRSDHGARRSLSTEMQHLIEGLALQIPPISIATLYRQVVRFAQQQEEKPPSYSRVYDIVRQLPPPTSSHWPIMAAKPIAMPSSLFIDGRPLARMHSGKPTTPCWMC